MKVALLFATALLGLAGAQNDDSNSDNFKKYTISAEGINASFIGYGARLTNLYVPDKNGKMQDVVLGYDDGKKYLHDTETNHTYFGPIVGRYANRIKNGTFTIDGVTSHVPENEHSGNDTLHGGSIGYDQRNWTVVSHNDTTITFSFLDAGLQGFPGTVVTYATYSVSPHTWTSRLVSLALDTKTPIMLANHVYWNLDAFTSGSNSTVLNDTLSMPYSARYIDVDGLEVPTGKLGIVNGTALDFYSKPKTIGQDILNATLCGAGCVGYDNAFIVDRPRYSGSEATDLTVLSWSSPNTGIKMDLATNQGGLQIYSCVGQNGTIGVKESQEHAKDTMVQKYGCLVIETQNWIDGINHPEWGVTDQQIYSPYTEPAVNWAQYTFRTVSDDSSSS